MTLTLTEPVRLRAASAYKLSGKIVRDPVLIPNLDALVVNAGSALETFDLKGAAGDTIRFNDQTVHEMHRYWHYPAPKSGNWSSIVHDGGTLYGVSGNRLYHIDVAKTRRPGRTDVVHWAQVPTTKALRPPVSYGSNLYVLDEGGEIDAIRKLTGGEDWPHKTWGHGGVVSHGPMVHDGSLCYIKEGILYALDPADGRERWTRNVTEVFDSWHPRLSDLPMQTCGSYVLAPLNIAGPLQNKSFSAYLSYYLDDHSEGESLSVFGFLAVDRQGVRQRPPTEHRAGKPGTHADNKVIGVVNDVRAWSATKDPATAAFVTCGQSGYPWGDSWNPSWTYTWKVGLLRDNGHGSIEVLHVEFPAPIQSLHEPRVYLVPDPHEAPGTFWLAWGSYFIHLRLIADGATLHAQTLKTFEAGGLDIDAAPIAAPNGRLIVAGTNHANESWLVMYDP